jgi:hypothetical protein
LTLTDPSLVVLDQGRSPRLRLHPARTIGHRKRELWVSAKITNLSCPTTRTSKELTFDNDSGADACPKTEEDNDAFLAVLPAGTAPALAEGGEVDVILDSDVRPGKSVLEHAQYWDTLASRNVRRSINSSSLVINHARISNFNGSRFFASGERDFIDRRRNAIKDMLYPEPGLRRLDGSRQYVSAHIGQRAPDTYLANVDTHYVTSGRVEFNQLGLATSRTR